MKRLHTSGIYLIRNTVTGRVYVGQSKNIELRNKNELFKKAINKDVIDDIEIYGISAFSCSTLEVIHSYDKRLMNARERFYIALYNSKDPVYGYNKTRGNYKECIKETYSKDNSSIADIQNRKVKCIDTGEVFDSYRQACAKYGNEVFRSIYKRRARGQKRSFVLLHEKSELEVKDEVFIKPPINNKRVSFIITDSYIQSHSLTFNELEPYFIKLLLREWVIKQERNEKRRVKYIEARKANTATKE